MISSPRHAVVRLTHSELRDAPRPWSTYAPFAVRRYGVHVYETDMLPHLDAVDLYLSGRGLPLRCQGDEPLRLTLREVNSGMDDYTALILGVGADA